MLLFAAALAQVPSPDERLAVIELAFERVRELAQEAHEEQDPVRTGCLEPKLEALGALVGASQQVKARLATAEELGREESARLEQEKLRIAEGKALALADEALRCLAVVSDGTDSVEVEEPELEEVEGELPTFDEHFQEHPEQTVASAYE